MKITSVLKKTGFFIFLLAGAASVGVVARAYGVEAPGTGALEERNSALVGKAELGEREKQLVSELLDWDLKIESARVSHDRLQEEIKKTGRKMADSQSALAAYRLSLDRNKEYMGRLVNFTYRYGMVGYLEVVLEAADFYDLINRLELLKTIINYQAGLIGETRTLMARVQEEQSLYERAGVELKSKGEALAWNISEMEQLRAGRKAMLDAARSESELLADRVVEAEFKWLRSLTSLSSMLEHLDALPWNQLSPENIDIGLFSARLEFSDEQINRVIFKQGSDDFVGLTVECEPGTFTIRGGKAGVNEFSISGDFVNTENGYLRYQPRVLILAEIPVSEQVLEFISKKQNLSFGGEVLPGYNLSNVQPGQDKLVVIINR